MLPPTTLILPARLPANRRFGDSPELARPVLPSPDPVTLRRCSALWLGWFNDTDWGVRNAAAQIGADLVVRHTQPQKHPSVASCYGRRCETSQRRPSADSCTSGTNRCRPHPRRGSRRRGCGPTRFAQSSSCVADSGTLRSASRRPNRPRQCHNRCCVPGGCCPRCRQLVERAGAPRDGKERSTLMRNRPRSGSAARGCARPPQPPPPLISNVRQRCWSISPTTKTPAPASRQPATRNVRPVCCNVSPTT